MCQYTREIQEWYNAIIGGNKDIIDEFVLSDFKKMDEEKTEIVNSWKKAIHGEFIVDRHLRKGSVLIFFVTYFNLKIGL